MATVFRVQKTKDFTVMSNHHLKNKDLSLRSKGLLSFMLSLPEDWDYSLKGLATLNKEGIDAIRSAINELEAFGYIERSRVRNEKGQLGENEYIIHELPISPEPKQTEPTLENPTLDNPVQAEPEQGKSTQLNTNKSIKDKLNTNIYKKESKKKEFEDILSKIEDEDIVNALGEFIEMRKTVKKPLTAHALDLNIKHLFELSNDKTTMIAIIEQSVMHNWLTFYALKEQDTSSNKKPQQSMYPNDFAF